MLQNQRFVDKFVATKLAAGLIERLDHIRAGIWKPDATADDVHHMPKSLAEDIYAQHYAVPLHYNEQAQSLRLRPRKKSGDLPPAIVPARASFPAVLREPFDLVIARYAATSF